MKWLLFLFLFLAVPLYADMPADSSVTELMEKYPESERAHQELKNKYSDVEILFLSPGEILKRSGHSGGGIRQDRITKKYEILINEKMSDEGKVHSITHELEHVKHDQVFDDFLTKNSDINKLGGTIVNGLKGKNRSQFIAKNRDMVNFIIYELFCTERKAYQANINLVKQGLEYEPKDVIKNPGKYISEHYVTQTFGIKMTDKEITSVEKKCLESESHLAFLKSIVPTKRTTASAH